MAPRSAMQQRIRTAGSSSAVPVKVGLLSTYPPTQCGLATFSASLRRSLLARSPGSRVDVVRMTADDDGESPDEVVYELHAGARGDVEAAADRLNRSDVVIVQHEYGIFGGRDGDQVLAVLGRVRVPVIVVLHTVLSTPTPHQKSVLEDLIAAADTVVTLSVTGYRRVCTHYQVDEHKIMVIPHGARIGERAVRLSGRPQRPVILTWGLLGPGKGVEWGIEALPALRGLNPLPEYVVAGQTHPRVLARHGERYRDGLRSRAEELRVADMLTFEQGYQSPERLRQLITRADVVLLPYDSHEQVTSGVLIEAVASLTPVVSTAFPHAREMLADGAGTLVPHGDAAAMGAALYRVLTEPAHAAVMVASAAWIAPSLDWSAVADRYLRLAALLSRDRMEVA